MTFVDSAKIHVKAGKGGDGLVSFRREKFVDRGGPDGGDGGAGGDIIFKATRNQNTLQKFRYKQTIEAESGQPGGRAKRRGKSGKDLIVEVPIGTVVKRDDQVLADLVEDGQTVVIALGGRGGYGNAHFISSTRRAPRIAEKGEPGEEFEVDLELKLLADVGLVGLPNVGKSTLLSVISNAKPVIADYPFTTIVPNLGVVDISGASYLFADIPGLIEEASKGKGLGDRFLKHTERTSVFVHLVDAYSADPVKDYKVIINELKNYKTDLSRRPQIVAISRADGVDPKRINEIKKQLTAVLPKSQKLYVVSAKTKEGIDELLGAVKTEVDKARKSKNKTLKTKTKPAIPTYTLSAEVPWEVKKTKSGNFIISGEKIVSFAKRTDFDNEWGRQRLMDILVKMGIMHELKRKGLEPGAKIKFRDVNGHLEF